VHTEKEKPPKKTIDPQNITKRLLRVLTSKNPEELLKAFFAWGLTFITPENLKRAVEEDIDPPTLLFNHYHLSHPIVYPLAQFVFKCFWDEIEYFITSVPRIYKLFIRNPSNKPILDTTKGRKYLNKICKRSYAHLYNFTWSKKL